MRARLGFARCALGEISAVWRPRMRPVLKFSCRTYVLLLLQMNFVLFFLWLGPAADAQGAFVDQTAQLWRGQLSDKDHLKVEDAEYQMAKHSEQFTNDMQAIQSLAALVIDHHQPTTVREGASYALGSIWRTASDAGPQLIAA